MWFGAHPADPSRVEDGRGLDEVIEADPVSCLGPRVVDSFGPRLPVPDEAAGGGRAAVAPGAPDERAGPHPVRRAERRRDPARRPRALLPGRVSQARADLRPHPLRGDGRFPGHRQDRRRSSGCSGAALARRDRGPARGHLDAVPEPAARSSPRCWRCPGRSSRTACPRAARAAASWPRRPLPPAPGAPASRRRRAEQRRARERPRVRADHCSSSTATPTIPACSSPCSSTMSCSPPASRCSSTRASSTPTRQGSASRSWPPPTTSCEPA